MKNHRKGKAKPMVLSPQALEQQGQEHLQAGRYKEAIDSYKLLIKQDSQPQWREALATAYLGRAEALAARGMFKEAAVLWENMTHLCDGERGKERYLIWLIKAGRYVRAANLYSQAGEQFQADQPGRKVAAWLGGLLVVETPELKAAFAQDAPLIRQLASAQAALSAYCRMDDTALAEHLKQIPYHSAYRDLRQFLQGMTRLKSDPASAIEFIDKIPADSPYAALVGAARMAIGEAEDLPDALTTLQDTELDFIGVVRGLTPPQLVLLKSLRRLESVKPKPSRKLMFEFILEHRQVFDATTAKRLCQSALAWYPEGVQLYRKVFGSLAEADHLRVHACQCEQRHDIRGAIQYWLEYVDCLQAGPDQNGNRLKAALVLRHCALLQPPFDEEQDRSLEWLIHSLELDPQHKDSYLEVLSRLDRYGQNQAYNLWLAKAIKFLPQDSDILMAAARTALVRHTYSKAAGYALNLLERDPINSAARDLLIDTHLAQAGKKITTSQYSAAEKLLSKAMAYAREDQQRGRIELRRGFLFFMRGTDHAALEHWTRGYRLCGGGIDIDCRLLIEARTFKLKISLMTQHLTRIRGANTQHGKPQVLAAMNLIHRTTDTHRDVIGEILEVLGESFKQAATLDFSEQEIAAICRVFAGLKSYTLLRVYADAALGRWGERPRFIYFQVLAKGKAHRVSDKDEIRLLEAAETALADGDFEIYDRIDSLIGIDTLSPPAGMSGFFEEEFNKLLEEVGPERLMELCDLLPDDLSSVQGPSRPKKKSKRKDKPPELVQILKQGELF